MFSTPRRERHLKKVSVWLGSLNHQAEFVSLVPPIRWQATFALVVVGKLADLGFRDLERSLVVDVLVVAGTEVVDDAHSLAHEVHHVLGVSAEHVVVGEDLGDALAENKTSVGNGVLVPEDRADFGTRMTGFCQVKNDGCHGILVGVGPFGCRRNVGARGAAFSLARFVHTRHKDITGRPSDLSPLLNHSAQ